jgi:uncharacterized phage protein gp47/JayE
MQRSIEYGVARALAGAAHGLHGHASWIVDQAFVQFAEREALLRRGDERGVPLNGASPASGVITVTGAGGNLPLGTLFVRADGWTFESTVAYTGLVPPASIAIEAADTFGGAEGNMQAGGALSFVSSVPGFDAAVTVGTGGLTGGAPEEDIEDYRERLLEHIRNPPLGGAPGDHVKWALEVSGVTRAWEYRGTNGIGNPALGRVAITFVMDDSIDIIPDAGMVEAVRAHVQSKSTAEVIVFAPTPLELDYTCSVVPNTALVRAAVEAEVDDMVRREAVPGKKLRLSSLDEVMSIADGEESHELTSPAVDIEPAFGVLLVPGTATFEDP